MVSGRRTRKIAAAAPLGGFIVTFAVVFFYIWPELPAFVLATVAGLVVCVSVGIFMTVLFRWREGSSDDYEGPTGS